MYDIKAFLYDMSPGAHPAVDSRAPESETANLARAYRKLDIHSRAELGARMAERRAAAAQM